MQLIDAGRLQNDPVVVVGKRKTFLPRAILSDRSHLHATGERGSGESVEEEAARSASTIWRSQGENKRREKSGPRVEFATASRWWIVHYHRLTIIDHLAVGLIDAGYVRDPKSSWRRARPCSFLRPARLFLINKATSKCAICANRFIDGAKQNGRVGLRPRASVDYHEFPSRERGGRASERYVYITNNYRVKCRIKARTHVPREL